MLARDSFANRENSFIKIKFSSLKKRKPEKLGRYGKTGKRKSLLTYGDPTGDRFPHEGRARNPRGFSDPRMEGKENFYTNERP
jgi:hypothetical protein